jgi:ribosomal-protein-alanine N-acetyltransferase
MIFLETTRLLFRSHEAGDEADFVSMHTDAEVRRYVGGQAWPVEKARSRFREQYLGRPAEHYGLWATVFKEEGKYIGCCGLRAPRNGMRASLGYYLARPYWRRGLGSEASQGFIDVAFTQLELDCVEADVWPVTLQPAATTPRCAAGCISSWAQQFLARLNSLSLPLIEKNG